VKRSLLLVCFFLSGAAGLVYEVLWTRILALSFGHTVWALTTVLAVFMGGLALGSMAVGRLVDRSGNPARIYALLELGIGLYCLAGPFLLDLCRHAHFVVLPIVGDTLVSRTALQFFLGVLVLIVPTTLMGGTVPAMARATIAGPATAGRRFGLLYGSNTMGAALGAFAAGYWLLPSIGIKTTNTLAAVVNIAIGAGLLLVRATGREEAETDTASPARPTESASSSLPVPERLLRWAFVLTGGTAMVFQVAWVRSLILVIGSSTYAYSAILVTFLFGIALGSYVFSRFRTAGPALASAILAGIAVSAFLLLPFFGILPDLFLALFKTYTENYAYIQLVQFFIVFTVILVPTTLMGMSLPCLTGMAVRDGERIGKDVGRYYAFNTAGAILGSVLAGFVLIPAIGSQKTIAVGIILELSMAAVFFSLVRPAWRNIVIPASVALGLAALVIPAWDKGVKNLSVYVYPIYSDVPKNYHSMSRTLSKTLLFEREGISSNVAVFGLRDGERWFNINGKTDGGTGDMGVQVKLAMFPMVLIPDARRIAVLGLGTGVTAATAGLFEGVESIDIVELEPAVVEAARFFERENGGILSDPRARLHIDDGRSFFASRRGAYDVIVSEPSNPWISGVSNLYTVEFFREIRESLAPRGVFGLWVQVYRISLESYRLIVRTFLDVFPDATLWQVGPGDTLILGRKDGEEPHDVASLKGRLRGNPRLSAAFGEKGDLPLEPLVAGYLLGPREMRLFAGAGERNTDDRNLLEFRAPRGNYSQELNRILSEIVRFREPVLPPFLKDPETESAAFHLRTGEKQNFEGNIAMALWELNRLPSLAPPQPDRTGNGVARLTGAEAREDFDGAAKLPFIPVVGPYRPEAADEESYSDWRADLAHLTRTSGVVRGAGWGGSSGLVLKGIRISPSGYLVPLEVEPMADYEVRCRMSSDAGIAGTAGVTVSEYDTPVDDGAQPTAAFNDLHLVRTLKPLGGKGSRGWSAVSFRFGASPKTRLVRIFFFLDGKQGSSAAFDDIVLKKTGSGARN
jgi:spermidine synthase